MIQGTPRESVESHEDHVAHDLAWMCRHVHTVSESIVRASEHRARILSWLSAQGIPTPDLDCLLMLGEERGGGRS